MKFAKKLSYLLLAGLAIGVASLAIGERSQFVSKAVADPPAMDKNMAEEMHLAQIGGAFQGKVDVYLSADQVAAGKPALSQVEFRTFYDLAEVGRYVEFRVEPKKCILLNATSIVAVTVAR